LGFFAFCCSAADVFVADLSGVVVLALIAVFFVLLEVGLFLVAGLVDFFSFSI